LDQDPDQRRLVGQLAVQNGYFFTRLSVLVADLQVSKPFHQVVFERAENGNPILSRLIKGNMKRMRNHAAQLASGANGAYVVPLELLSSLCDKTTLKFAV
jgi:hypothetical protein